MLIDPDLQKYLDDNNLVILRIGMVEIGETAIYHGAAGWSHSKVTSMNRFAAVVRPKYRPPTIEDIGVATCQFSNSPDFTNSGMGVLRTVRNLNGKGLQYCEHGVFYDYCRVVNS